MASLRDRRPSILVIDDEQDNLDLLQRALHRDFNVLTASSGQQGLDILRENPIEIILADHRMPGMTGVEFLAEAIKTSPASKRVILTGYANIATAVTAVKLGAVDYMSKPADADDVAAALLTLDGHKAEPPANPMSADRVRWEHIQRIYELCGRNVSETARRLNMHRRTLQRILAKRAPK